MTERAIGKKPKLPENIGKLLSRKRVFTEISAEENELKKYLLQV